MSLTRAIVVITSTQTQEQAKFLARTILEARLGACVQIVPIESLYRWKGEVEEAIEYRLEIKSMSRCYLKLERLILRHHHYETPEIIAIPLLNISAEYEAWLDAECQV